MKKLISLMMVLVLSVSSGLSLIAVADTANIESTIYSEATLEGMELEDSELLDYIEYNVLNDLDEELDGTGYVVDDVSAVYYSKEYLEELASNTTASIYFGYNLNEVAEMFQGEKYVFSLDDEYRTTVKPFEKYDDTFDKIVRNVAIGTGVILVCVTISAVTGGLGAPAISLIFATSAKTAVSFAVSSAVISGVASGVVTGIQTNDMYQAIKSAALSASDGFMWGAIVGAVLGGTTEAVSLGIATKSGLSLNDVALIKKATNLPTYFIKEIDSMAQYEELVKIDKDGGLSLRQMADVRKATNCSIDIIKYMRTTEEADLYFKEASLAVQIVDNKYSLVRNIDLSYVVDGETNLERMSRGLAAVDPISGKAYELHHIGQSVNSPLAILTNAEHKSSFLHTLTENGVHSLMTDSAWGTQRERFWKEMARLSTNP